MNTLKPSYIVDLPVSHWCSWVPTRIVGRSHCSHWVNGKHMAVESGKPSLDTVPAMLRRRLGSLGRVVFHVLDNISVANTQEAVVFSSRMGELGRTHAILESIANKQPVSPANFSLSVHNAIGGIWSQVRNFNNSIVAIAPPSYSPIPAIQEAIALLEEDELDAVNVVYYEEAYPNFYHPFLRAAAETAVFGCRILKENCGDSGMQTVALRLTWRGGSFGEELNESSAWLALPKLLNGKLEANIISPRSGSWSLSVAN